MRYYLNLFLKKYLLNFIKKKIFIFIILFIFIVINFFFSNNYNISNFKKKVLFFNINGIILENKKINNINNNFKLFKKYKKEINKNNLFEIVKIIRLAKKNKNILGIIFKLNNFLSANQTSLEYIGKVINEFKKSGKPVYSYSDNYNEFQYYLASYSNKIFIYPNGIIDFHGFYYDKFYYKNLLNNFKINSHVFRVGKEKTAIEPIIYNNKSQKTKDFENNCINKIWNNYIYDISKNRKIKPKTIIKTFNIIKNISNKISINKYNLKKKLVDSILKENTINYQFIKLFGFNKNKNNYNYINFYKYKIKNPIIKKNLISIIFLNGKILSCKNNFDESCSENVKKKLVNARLNPNIKAVILYINSPGGNINDSENIRIEISKLRYLGKPVIVLMGNMCTSGGYWIACSSNYIIANKSSITGSIGIFYILYTYEKTLNLIGINNKTTPLSIFNQFVGLKPYFSKIIELNIKNEYEKFIKLISIYRNITIEKVNNIANGKIFIGEDAKLNNLIDKIGDFDDAVKKAVELSNLKKWNLIWFY